VIPDSTNDTIWVKPTATTTYILHGSFAGFCRNTDTVVVNVVPHPQISFLSNDTVCVGDTVHLKAMNGIKYLWSTGDTTTLLDIALTQNMVISLKDTSGFCPIGDSVKVYVTARPV